MEQHLRTLLLDCLHPDRAVDADRLADLSASDGERFVALAHQQRVGGLLYRRLDEQGLKDAAPSMVVDALRETYRRTGRTNLRRYHELHTVATALHEADVPLLVLKGIHLAATVYPDPATRAMGDMDLMVPVDELETAARITRDLGYEPLHSFNVAATLAAGEKHLPRATKPGFGTLELHWTILGSRAPTELTPVSLWQRAEPVRLAETDVLALSSEDLLLHLCLHMAYGHVFDFGLRPCHDIAAVLRHRQASLAWTTVIERAHHWQCERGTYLALRLARHLAGASVPDHVIRTLEPHGFDERIIDTASRHAFIDRKTAHAVNDHVATLSSRSTFGRLTALWNRIFVPRHVVASQYGLRPDSRWLALFYPVRLRDMLLRHTATVFDLLRADPSKSVFAERKDTLQKWLHAEDTTPEHQKM